MEFLGVLSILAGIVALFRMGTQDEHPGMSWGTAVLIAIGKICLIVGIFALLGYIFSVTGSIVVAILFFFAAVIALLWLLIPKTRQQARVLREAIYLSSGLLALFGLMMALNVSINSSLDYEGGATDVFVSFILGFVWFYIWDTKREEMKRAAPYRAYLEQCSPSEVMLRQTAAKLLTDTDRNRANALRGAERTEAFKQMWIAKHIEYYLAKEPYPIEELGILPCSPEEWLALHPELNPVNQPPAQPEGIYVNDLKSGIVIPETCNKADNSSTWTSQFRKSHPWITDAVYTEKFGYVFANAKYAEPIPGKIKDRWSTHSIYVEGLGVKFY